MKKMILILVFLMSICHSFAQVEADSEIGVRTTEYSKIYGYKYINHDNRKPGWTTANVDIPINTQSKLQEAIVKSLMPEKLNKLKGSSILFSFNIQGNGKIESVEIIIPLNRNVDLSKHECHELITNIKNANLGFIVTDENTKKEEDIYIGIFHKVE